MLAHPMPVLESAIKQIGSRSMAASPRATTVGREASNRQEYPFRADGREADPEAPPRKRPNKRWSALGRQPSGGARVLDAPSAGAGIIQGGNQSVSLDEVLRSGHPMSLGPPTTGAAERPSFEDRQIAVGAIAFECAAHARRRPFQKCGRMPIGHGMRADRMPRPARRPRPLAHRRQPAARAGADRCSARHAGRGTDHRRRGTAELRGSADCGAPSPSSARHTRRRSFQKCPPAHLACGDIVAVKVTGAPEPGPELQIQPARSVRRCVLRGASLQTAAQNCPMVLRQDLGALNAHSAGSTRRASCST